MDEYISKEQFYKLAHIGKATALRLIQEGLVPAIDTGKPTNRYLILKSDAMFYLKDREENPEKYALVHRKLAQILLNKYDKVQGEMMRAHAERLWYGAPDLLSASEAAALLGYPTKTLLKWGRRGWVFRIPTNEQVYFPKKSLLDFVASEEFHSIRMKSETHMDLIRRSSCETTIL